MTAVSYRFGCTIAVNGDRVLWYSGHKPAWLMRLLIKLPGTYVDAQ